jgi:hypothetical protein
MVLAVTASGQKLPPYVVFKQKLMGKEKFPHGIVIWVQESDCMTLKFELMAGLNLYGFVDQVHFYASDLYCF